MQHNLVISLRTILQDIQRTAGIDVVVQDPEYQDLEKNVLAQEHISVRAIDHPFEGFLAVNAQTAVVSIAPDIPVKQIITDISRPALIIWNAASSPPFEDGTAPEDEVWRTQRNLSYV